MKHLRMKGRVVKLLSRNSNVSADWMLEARPIDRFMKSATMNTENVTRKELKLMGSDYLQGLNPSLSTTSTMMSAGYSVFFMEKHGNLVETGSKLVA